MVDPLPAWETAAAELVWGKPWSDLYVPDDHLGQWFVGGELNLTANLLDRHLLHHGGDNALIWEGEPGDVTTITYEALHRDVVEFASVLVGLGLSRGDRVALYTGLLPETVVTMLACARVGAVWSVLPAVLPAEAVSERLRDLRPRLLVTQDGAWRHGVVLPLKARADEALTATRSIEHTVVIRRVGIDVAWYEGDRWMHDLVAAPRPGVLPRTSAPVAMPAAAPAIVTYVANRRGQPTGVVHSTAGILVYTRELHMRGLGLGPGDVSWVPAELGWLAAQTHGIVGPLAAGGTALLYEGMLDTPDPHRSWQMIERHKVRALVATPSVVRALRRWHPTKPSPAQVRSLTTVVTAGEPLDSETRRWLTDEVGRGRVEVTNAWGQSELGGAVWMDRPLTGCPGLPDAGLEVLGPNREPVPPDTPGDLVLRRPWPAVARAFGNEGIPQPGVDPLHPGLYVTGDRAVRRADGRLELLGRSDRVLNVSGQLVSAAEIAGVLEEHPFVARAEVVDRPDTRTGRAVVACVVASNDAPPPEGFAADLKLHVHDELGGLARPQSVVFFDRIPEMDPAALIRALEALCATAPQTSTMNSTAIIAAAIEQGAHFPEGE